jgi:hypothetical protein
MPDAPSSVLFYMGTLPYFHLMVKIGERPHFAQGEPDEVRRIYLPAAE